MLRNSGADESSGKEDVLHVEDVDVNLGRVGGSADLQRLETGAVGLLEYEMQDEGMRGCNWMGRGRMRLVTRFI